MQPPPDIIAAAKKAQVDWKVPASVTLGQWALESGWGKSTPPGSNNPFGIKARVRGGVIIDPYVTANTDEEFTPGQMWHGPQPFRKFASLDEAFDYHGKLLATAPVYAAAFKALPNLEQFVRLMAAHYATLATYADRLLGVIRGSNLTQYDHG